MATANTIPTCTLLQRHEIRALLRERGLHPQISGDAHQPVFVAAGVNCPPGEFITQVLQQASKAAAHRLLTTLREQP